MGREKERGIVASTKSADAGCAFSRGSRSADYLSAEPIGSRIAGRRISRASRSARRDFAKTSLDAVGVRTSETNANRTRRDAV